MFEKAGRRGVLGPTGADASDLLDGATIISRTVQSSAQNAGSPAHAQRSKGVARRWRSRGVAIYGRRQRRSGSTKSSWAVAHWKVRLSASKTCTSILGP